MEGGVDIGNSQDCNFLMVGFSLLSNYDAVY